MNALLASRSTMFMVTPQQHRGLASMPAQPLLRVLQTGRTPTQLSLFSGPSRAAISLARSTSSVLRTSASKGSGQVAA